MDSYPEYKNFTVFCDSYGTTNFASWMFGEYKTRFPLIVVLFPIISVTLFTEFFQFLLKPLGHVHFVSQMLAAMIIGPSLLGYRGKIARRQFTRKVMSVLDVFEPFGLIYTFFVLSVRLDLGIIKKSGRPAIVLGLGSFLVPWVLATFIIFLGNIAMKVDENFRVPLLAVAPLQAIISFHSILSLLTDQKLLNSELGRLALSSSVINTLFSWLAFTLIGFVYEGLSYGVKVFLLKLLTILFIFVVIVFVLRPILLWMQKQSPERKSLKHSHVLAINMMVIGVALFEQITGNRTYLGTTILGIITPASPPMGSCLANKIEYFVRAVFVPCFVLNVGRRVDLFSIQLHTFLTVEFAILVSILAKIAAIIGTALYYKIPFSDAITLSIILNCRGIYDVQFFSSANQNKIITDEVFVLLILNAILQFAVSVPLIRVFCDLSRTYRTYSKRTIRQSEYSSKLRILVCIYETEDASTIINFLQASVSFQNFTEVSALNLEEYVGHSMPIIIEHQFDGIPSQTTQADHIIHAFRYFEQQNRGLVLVQCFTAIAPRASMYHDICLLAFERFTSLVVFPYQKSNTHYIKTTMKNVLKTAPCSVGILFDRGLFMDFTPIFWRRHRIRVGVVFVGGPDDSEALAYGIRMAENCSVMLTVIRFVHKENDLIKKDYDSNIINDFRIITIDSKNVEYREHRVTQGADTARVLSYIGYDFDLFLVGRRHDSNSPVLFGLTDWSEIEELGVIGDLLASSDFLSDASVMVIQKQT